MLGRLNDFIEDHAAAVITAGFLTVVAAYIVLTDMLDISGVDNASTDGSTTTPGGVATADAFPEPGETITQSHHIRRKDGTIATRTVREYRDAANRIIRETVREPVPGIKVTSTQTINTIGRTAPGTTSTATSIFTVPGQDTTVLQTVPGPGSTGTITATVRETVTQPAETVTVTEPGPDITVVEPGPTVTVTVTEVPSQPSP